MFDTIRKMLEMIRFSHTVFALPFALLAAAMAWAAPVPEGFSVGFRCFGLGRNFNLHGGSPFGRHGFQSTGRSIH